MAHPSSILRGKVLSVPILDCVLEGGILESRLADAVRLIDLGAPVLVTLSEGDPSAQRVLTVSGGRQRSLRQWKTLIAPVVEANEVRVDWDKALVLMADATHHG